MKTWMKEKWYIMVYFLFLGITICFLIHSGRSGEDYLFTRYDGLTFAQPWNYLFSDGTKGKTELPAQLTAGSVDELTLQNTLPELPEGVEFVYRSRHTSIKIYVGGELRYDSAAQISAAQGSVLQGDSKEQVKDTWFPLPGNIWNEVPLTTADSGKEIKIVSTGITERYLKGPGNVYLGDRGTFFIQLMKERQGTLVGAILLLLLAVVLFSLWIVLMFTTKRTYRECLCLALFTASVAFWELTETRCLQFFFQNMKLWGVLAYEILALTPVPIALYYSYNRRARTVRLSRIAAIVPLVVWVFNNALHFLDVVDISQTLLVTQLLNIFEILFVGYIQISDIISDVGETKQGHEVKFWWVPLVGLGIFIPLTLIEIMKYVLNIGTFHDDAILTNLGMIAYIMSLAFTSVLRLASENIRVKEASEAKTQFLANMSHEIRTPLNAVLGFDELILRDAGEPQILEYAAGIKSAGTSLRDTINSILDLTKIESGRMDVRMEEYSTIQMLDQTSSMIHALAEENGLYFKTKIDENIPETLLGDEIHIRQVLTNLLTNAVKYTRTGGVTFSVTLKQRADENGECVLLFSVKDTGIGIKEEDRERLFEKFERLDEEKNRDVEGTGLGMSIVVKLLELMDSQIELKSTYGEGSEFYFDLKQKVINAQKIGSFETASRKRADAEREMECYIAPSARILIVDDVELNLQVACGLLDGLEMQIDTAESGAQAIELVKQNHYDVIFMDHMMPGMDGIEATQKIRKLTENTKDPYYARVPVIALTANALSGMKEKFLAAGMQDFVAKPVEGKELRRVLREWLPIEKKLQKEAGKETEKETPDEWIVSIPGISSEDAKRYTPDRETYCGMLKTYVSSAPGIRERLKNYLEQQDRENYTVTVHGLKSATKVIGANEVSALAAKLEAASKTEPLETLSDRTEELLTLCESGEVAIRTFLGETETSEEQKQLSPEERKQFLKQLKAAAEEFDMDAFMQMGEQMKNMQVGEAYLKDWRELTACVENLSFSETIEKIEHMDRT